MLCVLCRDFEHDLSTCDGSKQPKILPIRIDTKIMLPRLKALFAKSPYAEPVSLPQAAWFGRMDVFNRMLASASHAELQSALCFAARQNQLSLVASLLGVDSSLYPESQKTRLEAVATRESKDTSTNTQTKQRPDPSAADPRSGECATFLAVKHGHLNVLRVLLDAKASVSSLSKDKRSLLNVAASRGDADIVRLLLHRRASPLSMNPGDENGPGDTVRVCVVCLFLC